MKWADYCISKISFDDACKSITDCLVHPDNDDTIGEGVIRNRNWLVQKALNGNTFCCISKNVKGSWDWLCDFKYEGSSFRWNGTLPKCLTRRKTFVSYYHHDDQTYRKRFENLFGDLIVGKSVEEGDIDSDNSDEYIKQLIQKDYLSDVTVLVVLVGAKTKCRKHIDWEIAGALNYKVGDNYAGIIGILLPTHPDYGPNKKYSPDNLPKRLAANVESGYATLHDWSDDRATVQKWIEEAYTRRKSHEKIVNKAIPQMQRNTCE